MPYGGRTQLSPAQAMVCKLPVQNGNTSTCSIMGWGFDPYVSEASPFKGAQEAVIQSVAKVIAAGGKAKLKL